MASLRDGTEPVDIEHLISMLFREAQENGAFDYTLALLRVGGIESGKDPLLTVREETADGVAALATDELRAWYCPLAQLEDPLSLIANLLRCSSKQTFTPFPFSPLITGTFPNLHRPDQSEKVAFITKLAADLEAPRIATFLNACYPEALLAVCENKDAEVSEETLRAACSAALVCWRELAKAYFAARLAFRGVQRFHKWPRFEVLELLTDEEYGLYGFKVYFSNGSHARYQRLADRTEAVNLTLGDSIGFMVGDLDAMEKRWRVGDQWLYEIGLPGRYNELGKWKPIIYEGDTEIVTRRVHELTPNLNTQGILFYMMCTGHRVIEFVVRASVDLPIEGPVSFGTLEYPVHLHKCAHEGDSYLNIRIYDGWVDINTGSPDEIESAVTHIDLALNRLAFAFDASLDWQLKYPGGIENVGGLATPNKEDVGLLEKILVTFPYEIDLALDWYNKGRASANPLTGFLCYFVAIELIVTTVYDSGTDVGVQVTDDPPSVRRANRIKCVQEMHRHMFSEDPVGFVTSAYSQCVQSLARRRKEVLIAVFGEGHPYLKLMFEPSGDEPSLTDIRNKVAHGSVSLLDWTEGALVGKRLGEIAQIAREFLLRVSLRLSSEEQVPEWSGKHTIGFSMNDPRSTHVANTDQMLPRKDWTIQPEWCQ